MKLLLCSTHERIHPHVHTPTQTLSIKLENAITRPNREHLAFPESRLEISPELRATSLALSLHRFPRLLRPRYVIKAKG